MQVGSFSDFFDTHGLDICFMSGGAYETNLFKPKHLDHVRSDVVILSACRAVELAVMNHPEFSHNELIRKVISFTWHAPVKTNLKLHVAPSLDASKLPTAPSVTGLFETPLGVYQLMGVPSDTLPIEEKFIFFPADLRPIDLDKLTFKVDVSWSWMDGLRCHTSYAIASMFRAALITAKTNTYVFEKISIIRRIIDVVPGELSPVIRIVDISSKLRGDTRFRRVRVEMGRAHMIFDVFTPETQETEAVRQRGAPLRTLTSSATAQPA
jgi:hypothetical protein